MSDLLTDPGCYVDKYNYYDIALCVYNVYVYLFIRVYLCGEYCGCVHGGVCVVWLCGFGCGWVWVTEVI